MTAGRWVQAVVRVGPEGQHARVAARIAGLARESGHAVRLDHATKRVEATSVWHLLSLAVAPGDKVTVTVCGEAPEAVLAAVCAALEGGESPAARCGLRFFPVGVGRAWPVARLWEPLPPAEEAGSARARLDDALARAMEEVHAALARLPAGSAAHVLAQAHAAVLADDEWRRDLFAGLSAGAELTAEEVVRRWLAAAMRNATAARRALAADVGCQLLRCLRAARAGRGLGEGPLVLVGRRVRPLDLWAAASAERPAGVVSVSGGLEGHLSIAARGWGVPCAIGPALRWVLDVPAGEWLRVNGTANPVQRWSRPAAEDDEERGG